jgi:hypothetical protein
MKSTVWTITEPRIRTSRGKMALQDNWRIVARIVMAAPVLAEKWV